jgi:curved DNA-binding protein CbpA
VATPDPLEKLDYYSLLSVDPAATPDQIRRAFHVFAAKYHPDRFLAKGAEPEHVERANQIYRRGAEAYKVLTNQARRRLYDGQLAGGKLRFDPMHEAPVERTPYNRWPIKVKSPMARPFATKAEQAFKAGEWNNAKVNLRMALSKDAGNEQITLLLAEVEQKLAPG